MTSARVGNPYRFSAFYAVEIPAHGASLGHVPITDLNPGRSAVRKQEQRTEATARRAIGYAYPENRRYRERFSAERVKARLKEEFGGRHLRLRGHGKALCHLMSGILALCLSQLLRLPIWVRTGSLPIPPPPGAPKRETWLAHARPPKTSPKQYPTPLARHSQGETYGLSTRQSLPIAPGAVHCGGSGSRSGRVLQVSPKTNSSDVYKALRKGRIEVPPAGPDPACRSGGPAGRASTSDPGTRTPSCSRTLRSAASALNARAGLAIMALRPTVARRAYRSSPANPTRSSSGLANRRETPMARNCNLVPPPRPAIRPLAPAPADVPPGCPPGLRARRPSATGQGAPANSPCTSGASE